MGTLPGRAGAGQEQGRGVSRREAHTLWLLERAHALLAGLMEEWALVEKEAPPPPKERA